MTQTSIDEIQRELLKKTGAWRDVQRITSKSVNRQALLNMLVIAVMTESEKSVASRMRKIQGQQGSLAGQIRTVARHIERAELDPNTHLDLWSPFRNQSFCRNTVLDTKCGAPLRLVRAMRRYADWAEEQASKFGDCLRKNARKERDLNVMWLLFQVHLQTGELFAKELARLLTHASEATGRRRIFTPDQLTKMFKRHVFSNPPGLHPDNPTP